MEGDSRLAWKRLGLLFAFVAFCGVLLFLTPLRELLEPRALYGLLARVREHPAAPFLFVLGFVVLAVIGAPLVPLIIAGGAVFGFLLGTVLNYVATLLATSASFAVARYLGQDAVLRLLGSRRYTLERLLRSATFWPMVRLRFLPVPFPVANYGSALLGVSYPVFAASTAVAYVPILMVYSYFAAALVSVGEGERSAIIRNLTLAALAMAALTFLPPRIAAWRARRRRSEGSAGSPVNGREPSPPPEDR